ncbi:TlpA disulfide reductase family protein [Mesonia aestuariivivens]|uniref:TlpA family protein disulfide reductase n=1 Tax=Mesonia aestuariivivens TaxID=2796128 RepID=A0ABS6VZ68_9FLAO|nr:TlpA disulfide reductase family protein [Mesonia aestuariivivens]MBW2960888.1 TlpA family protein disulfide reductase [Mesonia aestuariivivens]
MNKWILILGLILLVISCKDAGEKENVKADFQSLEIPTYNFNQLEAQLPNDEDKTYIVNFWATWCAPCVEELPYFTKLNKEENNVEVILVSLDMPNMKESQLLPFVEKNNINAKVILLDDPRSNNWIPKVDENWDGAIPATLLYNTKNREFYPEKFDTYQELLEEVEKFKNAK